MSVKQGTEGSQGSRRSTRLNKGPMPESISDTGMISGSPTHTWSCDEDSIRFHSDATVPENEQLEENMFMRTTQEVAETLARMKSRGENRDRSHEVCCVYLNNCTPFLNVQRSAAGPALSTATYKRSTRSNTLWFSSCFIINTNLQS